MRYIQINPVQAALADDPAHYRWTCYRANGLGQSESQSEPCPTRHEVYLVLGAGDAGRRKAYRELFRSGLDAAAVDGIRLALNQNQPLGDSVLPPGLAAKRSQLRPTLPGLGA